MEMSTVWLVVGLSLLNVVAAGLNLWVALRLRRLARVNVLVAEANLAQADRNVALGETASALVERMRVELVGGLGSEPDVHEPGWGFDGD